MKLDRDNNTDGLGKYAVLNLRKLDELCHGDGPFQRWTPEVANTLKTLDDVGAIDWGRTGEKDEFFVLKLRDKYAGHALRQYAHVASRDDLEYAHAVLELASRAGENSPFCKTPD